MTTQKQHGPIAAEMETLRAAEKKAHELLSRELSLTDPYRWSGELEAMPAVVAALRFAGLTSGLQIKLVTATGALRISDYNTRATAQPGEYFWLAGDKICGGDLEDYAAAKEKASAK